MLQEVRSTKAHSFSMKFERCWCCPVFFFWFFVLSFLQNKIEQTQIRCGSSVFYFFGICENIFRFFEIFFGFVRGGLSLWSCTTKVEVLLFTRLGGIVRKARELASKLSNVIDWSSLRPLSYWADSPFADTSFVNGQL